MVDTSFPTIIRSVFRPFEHRMFCWNNFWRFKGLHFWWKLTKLWKHVIVTKILIFDEKFTKFNKQIHFNTANTAHALRGKSRPTEVADGISLTGPKASHVLTCSTQISQYQCRLLFISIDRNTADIRWKIRIPKMWTTTYKITLSWVMIKIYQRLWADGYREVSSLNAAI